MAHIVILTGGARPGDSTPMPSRNDLDLALADAGVPDSAVPRLFWEQLTDAQVTVEGIVTAAFRTGYAKAAQLHRAVAAWILEDPAQARQFAAWATRAIDPAYVITARDPLAEMLTEQETRNA